MILFFFGNDYLIHCQVQKIKDRYREKAGGDLNLTTLDGETLIFGDFARQTEAMPLLATSRLIIVRDIFKNKNRSVLDQIKETLKKIPPSTILVFTQTGEPDRRLGLFKTLSREKAAKFFKNIELEKLPSFIARETAARGGEIEPAARELLADYVGADLWRLKSEIEKLLAYSDNRITAADVESQITKQNSGNAFALIDNLAHARKSAALRELDALLSLGEAPLRILALVNYQYRTIAQVKDALGQANNPYAIAKFAGLSPFQVGKALPLAKQMSWQVLSSVYQKLLAIDEQIKTGRIEDGEGLKELVLSL